MICDYGITLCGKSHIAKDKVCQDNHKIKKLSNGWVIAAVADGVGSAPHSDIGSKIAVDTLVEMCEELMPYDYNEISIKSMLRTVYNYALKKIIKEAEEAGNPPENYDTTLTAVIYDGKRIIYGHSGDGGIIGLTSYGKYVEITKPQKGEDNISVIPLRAGYASWEINSYEEDLASVILVTDGMLDILCPYLLNLDKDKSKVYVPLISYFADPVDMEKDNVVAEIEEFVRADEDYDVEKFYKRLTEVYKARTKDFEECIEGIKKYNFPLTLMDNVQDDKTIVALVNTEEEIQNSEGDYYTEPDWKALQEAFNRLAYPHLYKDEEVIEEPSEEPICEEEKDKVVVNINKSLVNVVNLKNKIVKAFKKNEKEDQ